MAIKPVRVSQLNSYIKRILQSDPLLSGVSVIGEISNLKFHGSGHVYFTLKDENSKINCFLAYENFQKLRFEIADGMEITAEGYIYLYEKGGTYSLNIRDIRMEGIGNLTIAFEKLKEKLAKEGLFDEKYKKPIPAFPGKIAVITSETGAAVKDIVKIIKNRNNLVDVLIYPVLVQGPGAAPDISEAIRQVNLLFPETDTIIVGRGGGSMEELWAFNEEIVVRSIFESKIPIISAVGHEIDFTISDFVADKRAETPTAAAQMAVPDITEIRGYMEQLSSQMLHRLNNQIKVKELQLRLSKELFTAVNNLIYNKNNRIDSLKSQLEALSPKNIMARGYSAVLNKDGKLISSVNALSEGDLIRAVMIDGMAEASVLNIRKDN